MSLARSLPLGALALAACTTPRPSPIAVPDLGKRAVAERGMVAAGSAYAAEAGVEMLRQGGNAVDAAVAATFAIGVVEPSMSGIGAGGGMMIWNQQAHRADYVDFYGTAGASPDTALRSRGTGRIAAARGVAIPGAVAGLLAAHEKYGKLPRATVLGPAIRLAADGFIANSILIRELQSDSTKVLGPAPVARIFFPGGHMVRVGDRVVQSELAATLRRIADQGRDGFYTGPVAAEIVSTLNAGGNPATLDDFARYAPRWKRPLCTTYRGRVVLSAPAPQGGMQVLETLNLLEPVRLTTLGAPHRDVAAFRALAGAMRAAVTDRDAYVGDPDKAAVPQAGLTSKAYAAERAAVAADTTPRARLAAGDPWAEDRAAAPESGCAEYQPVGPARVAAVRDSGLGTRNSSPPSPESRVPSSESSETTHLSIVDADGNAVSVTNTNGLAFGTGTWAAGAFFNSAMLNFARSETSANAIGPWRVPSSTIAPTVVLEHGRVREVVGSPGSAAIPPAVVETIVYTLDYGLDPLAALRVPRVIPSSNAQLRVEMGFAEPVLDAARRMGFETIMSPMDMGFGGVHVIERVGGRWVGAADPRRDGEVRGY
ncbi:gamma-glutamyltranspeptidase [Gemmatirosa kalamazoonensis]|uniref:Gamma-glutamyltranspeptidase n=1 Tax=Gemmatirosa kalamazoonensis TaxID=861299 RepID=W0RH91_9BACT|nr:gamma-glutamyltransferase [Gemmatirosa kalamazoonensis]AHG88758.1 gamma-glutamyltranspeptidase [Gemmatirosa kalamazoonensis]